MMKQPAYLGIHIKIMANINELSENQRVIKSDNGNMGTVLYTIFGIDLEKTAREKYKKSRRKNRDAELKRALFYAKDSVRINFDNGTLCTLYCSQVTPI